MPQGPIITNEVKVLIASVHQKHPKWKAPEVRNEVDYILHKRNPKLPHGWPSLSTVQKVLATVRKIMKEEPVDPRDKPWSTASMVKYPIPPEALPSILQLWVWTRENLNVEFTIREAEWAARFYTVTKDIPPLSFYSKVFAITEKLYEQLGLDFGDGKIDHGYADLSMFSLITGRKLTPEQEKKILGFSDEEWLALQEQLKFDSDFPKNTGGTT